MQVAAMTARTLSTIAASLVGLLLWWHDLTNPVFALTTIFFLVIACVSSHIVSYIRRERGVR